MGSSDTLVAVISYHNAGLTIDCINSLCSQTKTPDIILWDNNSDYMTVQQLKAFDFPGNVKKIFSSENLLWSPAINKIFQTYSNGYKYIGFMNNDIFLQPHTIENLTNLLEDQAIGLVGPMGSNLGGGGDYAVWSQKALAKGIPESEFRKYPLRVSYVVGACCFLRKVVWDQLDGLDESMPLGAEDHDTAIRIKQIGYSIYADPREPCTHIGHATKKSDNWNIYNQLGWQNFEEKVSGYFRTRAEAILCHWGGIYTPGWDVGTGWLKDQDREPIYELRRSLHEKNLKRDQYQKIFTEEQWNGGF